MFIIYGLHEAGNPDDIKYVGLTGRALVRRFNAHVSDARRRQHPAACWLSRAKQSGTVIECRTLQRVQDAQRGAMIEKKWIAHYARKGSLLNVYSNPTVKNANRGPSRIFKLRAAEPPKTECENLKADSIKNFLQYLRNLPM